MSLKKFVVAGVFGLIVASMGLSTSEATAADSPAGKSLSSRYNPYSWRSRMQRRYAQSRKVRAAILAFAQSKMGQQVGNGECWTLAAEAMAAGGAKAPNSYDFGTELDGVHQALPGDVIQFTSAKFVSGNSWWMMGSPNHTAIIESVSGSTVGLLQQNTNGNRTVSRQVLDLNSKTQGSFVIYRVQPR